MTTRVASADDEQAIAVWKQFRATLEQVFSANYTARIDYGRAAVGKPQGSNVYELQGLRDDLSGNLRLRFRGPQSAWNLVVQKPDSHLYFNEENKFITRNTGQLDFSDAATQPFDVFAAPLMGAASVIQGGSLAVTIRSIESCEMTIQDSDNPKQVVVLLRPKSTIPVRSKIVFDSTMGMVPIVYLDALMSDDETVQWETPLNRAETVWKRISDTVVVPEVIESYSAVGTDNRAALVTVSWLAVNEPVDSKEFEIDALNLPVGTEVVDRTLGPPIVERIVGKDLPTAVFEHNRKSHLVHQPRSSYFLLVMINSLLLLLGIGWFWKRKSIATK